jgi:hypothetical protein
MGKDRGQKKCVVCKKQFSRSEGKIRLGISPPLYFLRLRFYCDDCLNKGKKLFYIFIVFVIFIISYFVYYSL